MEQVNEIIQSLYGKFGDVFSRLKTMADIKVHYMNQYAVPDYSTLS